MAPQAFQNDLGRVGCVMHVESVGELLPAVECLEDFLLGLLREAGQGGKFACFTGLAERVDGVDAELLVERGNLLGAKSVDFE